MTWLGGSSCQNRGYRVIEYLGGLKYTHVLTPRVLAWSHGSLQSGIQILRSQQSRILSPKLPRSLSPNGIKSLDLNSHRSPGTGSPRFLWPRYLCPNRHKYSGLRWHGPQLPWNLQIPIIVKPEGAKSTCSYGTEFAASTAPNPWEQLSGYQGCTTLDSSTYMASDYGTGHAIDSWT